MKINAQQSTDLVKPENTNNRSVSNIQKQIQSLQEQLSQVKNSSTMSLETKLSKQKALEEKIAALNEKLKQEQTKQKKAEEAKKQEKQAALQNQTKTPNDDVPNNGFTNDEMQAMVTASTSFNNAKAINHVRTHMSGQAHNLKGEIAVIESRGGNPAEQKQQLGELEQNINTVTSKLVQEYGKASNSIKTSHTAKDEEKTQEDKEESNKDKISSEEFDTDKKAQKNIDIKL